MKKLVVMALCLMSSPAWADPQSAVAAVRAIPGVETASEDAAGNLFVFVKNSPNGQWNRAAAGFCKLVRPHEARIFLVKIIDRDTVKPKSKPTEWGMLGAANCGMVP